MFFFLFLLLNFLLSISIWTFKNFQFKFWQINSTVLNHSTAQWRETNYFQIDLYFIPFCSFISDLFVQFHWNYMNLVIICFSLFIIPNFLFHKFSCTNGYWNIPPNENFVFMPNIFNKIIGLFFIFVIKSVFTSLTPLNWFHLTMKIHRNSKFTFISLSTKQLLRTTKTVLFNVIKFSKWMVIFSLVFLKFLVFSSSPTDVHSFNYVSNNRKEFSFQIQLSILKYFYQNTTFPRISIS